MNWLPNSCILICFAEVGSCTSTVRRVIPCVLRKRLISPSWPIPLLRACFVRGGEESPGQTGNDLVGVSG